MGDSQFFQALRAFNTDPRFRYGNATTADFQAVCERFYHGDLSRFFLQWIYRPGHPHFSVNWEVNGSDVKLAIHDTTFSPNQFRMPLDVILDTKAGEEKHRLWVEPGLNTFELKAKAPVVTVRPVGLRWILDGPKTGTMTYFTDLDFIKGTFLDSLVFTNDRKLFVGGQAAAWESPARSLFPGARWLKVRLDRQTDPRYARVRLLVRAYDFLKRKSKSWLLVPSNGVLPDSLQCARRLQMRLEFGDLVGQTLPLPRVVVSYGKQTAPPKE